MHAWRSSGRVGAREGRVVNVLMSTCVLRRVERAVVKFWIYVSGLLERSRTREVVSRRRNGSKQNFKLTMQ